MPANRSPKTRMIRVRLNRSIVKVPDTHLEIPQGSPLGGPTRNHGSVMSMPGRVACPGATRGVTAFAPALRSGRSAYYLESPL
jgi:hypothetical protein